MVTPLNFHYVLKLFTAIQYWFKFSSIKKCIRFLLLHFLEMKYCFRYALFFLSLASSHLGHCDPGLVVPKLKDERAEFSIFVLVRPCQALKVTKALICQEFCSLCCSGKFFFGVLIKNRVDSGISWKIDTIHIGNITFNKIWRF